MSKCKHPKPKEGQIMFRGVPIAYEPYIPAEHDEPFYGYIDGQGRRWTTLATMMAANPPMDITSYWRTEAT